MPKIRISFSLSAVARIGVPPGKWFCLGRTGLGYAQYSCCVCAKHHEVFNRFWSINKVKEPDDWARRLDMSITDTLIEFDYGSSEKGPENIEIIRSRIMQLLLARESYFINSTFQKLLENPGNLDVRILTNGPNCLIEKIFPRLPNDKVFGNLYKAPAEKVESFSDIHVGTTINPLIPQTKFLISRKKFSNIPQGVKVYPRLDDDVFNEILSSRNAP